MLVCCYYPDPQECQQSWERLSVPKRTFPLRREACNNLCDEQDKGDN